MLFFFSFSAAGVFFGMSRCCQLSGNLSCVVAGNLIASFLRGFDECLTSLLSLTLSSYSPVTPPPVSHCTLRIKKKNKFSFFSKCLYSKCSQYSDYLTCTADLVSTLNPGRCSQSAALAAICPITLSLALWWPVICGCNPPLWVSAQLCTHFHRSLGVYGLSARLYVCVNSDARD